MNNLLELNIFKRGMLVIIIIGFLGSGKIILIN